MPLAPPVTTTTLSSSTTDSAFRRSAATTRHKNMLIGMLMCLSNLSFAALAAAAEGSGPGLVSLQVNLMFWTLVIFGLLYFIVKKWGFPAILAAVEDAGIKVTDIDGFSSYSDDRNSAVRLASALGIPELLDGIEIVLVAVGLFAVGELLAQTGEPGWEKAPRESARAKHERRRARGEDEVREGREVDPGGREMTRRHPIERGLEALEAEEQAELLAGRRVDQAEVALRAAAGTRSLRHARGEEQHDA